MKSCAGWGQKCPADETYPNCVNGLPYLRDKDSLPTDSVQFALTETAPHRLRVEVTPDQHVGVLQTRGQHADPHLAPAGRRHGSVDHLQPIGTAEVPDFNNPVARLFHGMPGSLAVRGPST